MEVEGASLLVLRGPPRTLLRWELENLKCSWKRSILTAWRARTEGLTGSPTGTLGESRPRDADRDFLTMTQLHRVTLWHESHRERETGITADAISSDV